MHRKSSRIARSIFRVIMMALTVWTASLVFAAVAEKNRVVVVDLTGVISPATTEFLHKALQQAQDEQASLFVIRMDTPGGLDTSMRGIIQDILASPVPVVTYVHPEGARAASAGTYILYASHIAAMTPATNLGAATPVSIGGGGKSPQSTDNTPATETDAEENTNADSPSPSSSQPVSADASAAKAVNDAAAYIRGLAQLRGRNAEFAEQAVRQAASLSASEAYDAGVIDLVAADLDELLAQLDGRQIDLGNHNVTLSTRDAEIVHHEPGLRYRILSLLANPQVALILMMLGVYGLFYEFTSPGFGVPGVAGSICLIVALYSLHMMPINWAGVALIGLGIALMIAEALLPSFGVFGIGGIAAFVVGGLFLMDSGSPELTPSPALLVAVALVSAVVLFFIGGMAMKSYRRPVVSGREDMLGRTATVIAARDDDAYWVEIYGERWRALSATPLNPGQPVRIEQIDGLTLHVFPLS